MFRKDSYLQCESYARSKVGMGRAFRYGESIYCLQQQLHGSTQNFVSWGAGEIAEVEQHKEMPRELQKINSTWW